MPQNAIWIPLVLGALALGYTLIHRSTAPRRRPVVDALIMRLELPVDDHVITLIDRRVRDNMIGTCAAGFIALVLVGGLAAVNGGFPEGQASTVLGLVFVAAASLGSAAAGVGQFSTPSSRGARIARANTPREGDYVHPLWQWASVGVSALAALCGCAILLGLGPEIGGVVAGVPVAAVVGATSVAVVAQLAAALLGRWLVDVPQPAQNELELRWDDAMRGMALRSLWIAAFTLGWAACLLAGLWLLAPAPTITAWLGFVAVVPILLLSVPASRRSTWRLWPDAADTEPAAAPAVATP
ncbi:hypothetical protein ASC66_11075 [Leifsonia sp. Root4]|uniref:hypothetical protein n=1 Tax=Leifsonia sp. Root4 TaxID=1736525 RepID=UPI0006F829DF|nr:hypothetical protein [Leifsonia sp. Root4]KQW05531.1 hypothetical protein ASC66_11075 [Leifsonia sp. Root4]